MNSKIIGIVLITIIILGGGVWWVISQPASRENTGAVVPVVEEVKKDEVTSEATPTSLKDLLTQGRAQRCTFSDSETASQGEVYVANSKARGNFTSVANGQSVGSHMIVDGNTVSVWIDGQATGFTMALDATQQSIGTSAQQQFDASTTVDYDCQPWTVQANMFTLPGDVQFSDLTATMGAAADMSATQCAACDSAPAESRAACRAALKCK